MRKNSSLIQIAKELIRESSDEVNGMGQLKSQANPHGGEQHGHGGGNRKGHNGHGKGNPNG